MTTRKGGGADWGAGIFHKEGPTHSKNRALTVLAGVQRGQKRREVTEREHRMRTTVTWALRSSLALRND